MTFGDIPANAAVFLDANTLVYHFEPHPNFGPACTALIKSIELQQLVGFTATHVIGEVAIMQHHGLTHLASHDADFDRVSGITRYAAA